MKRIISIAAVITSSLLYMSCQQEILVGDKVDMSRYGNVTSLNGYLQAGSPGSAGSVVELAGKEYTATLRFGMSRVPQGGAEIKLSYDPSYVQAYNALHGTDLEAYPETGVALEADGRITVAPDGKKTYTLGLTVSVADNLVDGQTYVLPVKAESLTEGVNIPEDVSRCVFLVKNTASAAYVPKDPDAVKTFLFFEVNDTNPMNAIEYVLEDGSMFFDYVVLFAANINYDRERGEVYVNNNPNVQFILDNRDKLVKPLQDRGIKVLLGLLGNHDEAGLAQLSDIGARQFADNLAAMCEAYGLDGVNFDDEYSAAPDLSNPLFTQRSTEAAGRLVYETKLRMPDKAVTVFDWGDMYGCESVDGVPASEWCDIVVANYGSSAYPVGGMTLKQCSGASIEMNLGLYGYGSPVPVETASRVVSGGYGYFMLFAPFAGDYDAAKYRVQVESFKNGATGLYGQPLRAVTRYWEKEAFEPVAIPF